MAAVRTRITISEAQIKRFTLKGGSVHGAVRRLSEGVENRATQIVLAEHTRTGKMASSISAGENWSNGRESRFTIRVGVSYAKVVLEGYKGYIYPKHVARNYTSKTRRKGTFSGRRPRLPVGKSQGGPVSTWTFATKVKGQRGDNFLRRALRAVMEVQGYL
jgi:hypothetical protein